MVKETSLPWLRDAPTCCALLELGPITPHQGGCRGGNPTRVGKNRNSGCRGQQGWSWRPPQMASGVLGPHISQPLLVLTEDTHPPHPPHTGDRGLSSFVLGTERQDQHHSLQGPSPNCGRQFQISNVPGVQSHIMRLAGCLPSGLYPKLTLLPAPAAMPKKNSHLQKTQAPAEAWL